MPIRFLVWHLPYQENLILFGAATYSAKIFGLSFSHATRYHYLFKICPEFPSEWKCCHAKGMILAPSLSFLPQTQKQCLVVNSYLKTKDKKMHIKMWSVYSGPLPMFIYFICFLFIHWFLWFLASELREFLVLCIFWISTPYWICSLQIFSPFNRLPLHFVDGFLYCEEAF